MEKMDKKCIKMRILIIRTFPDRLDLNSYNVQEVGLARALSVRGHQCAIVLYGGKEQDRKETYSFMENGTEYSFLVYWMKGYCILKNGFIPSVRSVIGQYDLIQVHEYDQIMSWQLYSKMRKPTVVYHGPYLHPYTKGYNLKCRFFDLLFLRRRSYGKVVALAKSELAAEFLRKKGFKYVFPVGVGINTENFCLADGQRESFSEKRGEERIRLLYVGKIEERRNVYFLIEVFRRLCKMHQNIQLILVGDGAKDYREAFLQSIAGEIEKQTIVYRQKASQTELAEIYMGADLFLFTSNYEIFGMVLLEAMYFGLPVFSTVNGGSSMLIRDGENGYVFEDFDTEQWVDRISALLMDREKRRNIGQRAKQTIEDGYTWDHLAERFETAYRKAVSLYEEK